MANRDQILQGAEKLLAKGKLDAALKEYLRVLEENPKDISTLNKVGDLYVRINRPSDSIPFFTRIADFYARDGFFLKAIAIYKKINKIDPARLDVYEQLADLYHKQGLTQDARSQYQVLADHYSKNNKPEEAIAAYKKMVTVDPGDLKIQARLADLYRSHRQINQAVAQYGLIGSALIERGAHEESVAVLQKALDLAPGDPEIQRTLVRALLAQKNPAAAIAILKKAPESAAGLALLAEAQFETGDPVEAIRTAERGLSLDPGNEACRIQLSRIRLAQGNLDPSFAVILPVVDSAIAQKNFVQAAGHLAPILEADPGHRGALAKMGEIREAEGKSAEAASLFLAAAKQAERRGDTSLAVDLYRSVTRLTPGEAEALTRLKDLIPPPAAAPAPDAATVPEIEVEIEEEAPPVHAPQPQVPSLAFEAPEAPAAWTPPPPAAAPPQPVEDREVETLVVEAEVFARYGLTDKAVERLRLLVRRRPDLLRARERLVELMAESQNPALSQEVSDLAQGYRDVGRHGDAEALLGRFGMARPAAAPPAPPPPPPVLPAAPASAPDTGFDEFGLDSGVAHGPVMAEPPPAAEPLEEPVEMLSGEIPPPAPEPPMPRVTSSMPIAAPAESEFVSYEELGSLLEEEMQKASEEPAAPEAVGETAIDEQSLFADEQQFFNLAEELEKELAD